MVMRVSFLKVAKPCLISLNGGLALNPDCAVASYCDLKILAVTLVSRFCSSTYLWICLRHKIAPTARFAMVFCVSLWILLHKLGLNRGVSSDRLGAENRNYFGGALRPRSDQKFREQQREVNPSMLRNITVTCFRSPSISKNYMFFLCLQSEDCLQILA